MWFTVAFSFLKGLIPSIVANWKPILVGTFIGLLAYVMFSPWQFLFGLDTLPSLRSDMVKLEHSLELSKENLMVCADANKMLSKEIDDQNTNIKAWGDLSKKIDESSAELKKKIESSRQQSKKDVENILNGPTPVNCEAAMDYMRDSIKSGELSWK